VKKRGEARWEWIVNRDEHGYPTHADIVYVTEEMAAEERAEIEAAERARLPVMADLRPWLEARGGKS
jgi:hypothetical protein